eukprot:scaffold139_cov246-Pinguiococcus_pyrenoidosus.AAC.7
MIHLVLKRQRLCVCGPIKAWAGQSGAATAPNRRKSSRSGLHGTASVGAVVLPRRRRCCPGRCALVARRVPPLLLQPAVLDAHLDGVAGRQDQRVHGGLEHVQHQHGDGHQHEQQPM